MQGEGAKQQGQRGGHEEAHCAGGRGVTLQPPAQGCPCRASTGRLGSQDGWGSSTGGEGAQNTLAQERVLGSGWRDRMSVPPSPLTCQDAADHLMGEMGQDEDP